MPLDWVDDELAALEARGRLRGRRVVGARDGARLSIDGRTLISFSSNDYLGLATDPRLVAAATAAMAERGFGAGASRLITGNLDLAQTVEVELAAWLGAPAACLFNSGYASNTGVMPVLAGEGDLILSDELNHASLIDGCRLSRARVVVYRHADVDDLRSKLSRSFRRVVIATESVFSMEGDVAPLAEIRAAAPDAILLVDDAHAIGWAGEGGRGLGVAAGADVVVGTMGKALGAAGAFVLGPRNLLDLLWNKARPLVFSTGLPVPVLAAARAAVALLSSATDLRDRLLAHMSQVSSRLDRPVYSPIIPLWVGDDRVAMDCTRRLIDQGFLVQGIRPPTVPEGTARLRLSLSTAHDPDDLARLLTSIESLMAEGLIVSRAT